MINRYVHLGYPKCASTSLQFDYFPMHPQIRHLGKGCNRDQVGYASAKIKELVELGLRFKNSFDFDSGAYKQALEYEFEVAGRQPEKIASGISSENLSISYSDDIDVEEKADRIFEVFGDGTKILFIIRNQKSLITSLYKEGIKQGYNLSFADFLRLTRLHGYKNWLLELDPWRIFNVYRDRFGARNICVIPFEKLIANEKKILGEIGEFLGVDPLNHEFSNRNRQFTDETLHAKWILNQRVYYGLQRPIGDPSHTFKLDLETRGEDIWKTHLEAQIEQHIILALNNLASSLAESVDIPPIDTEWSPDNLKIYRDVYAPGNAALNAELNLGLETLNYWL